MSNSVIGRIYDIYHSLSAGERRVADYVLSHAKEFPYMTTIEARDAIGVSEPTIFRFCKAMGYNGIKDLRIQLAFVSSTEKEAKPTKTEETPKTEVEDLVFESFSTMQRVAEITHQMLDHELLARLAEQLMGARRITLFGVGSSYLACYDARRKLQRLGAFAIASNSMSDTLATINQMSGEDVLVVISHSGTTMDAEQVIRVGAMHGVITVMITSYPDAPAAKHAQYLVKTYAPETPYGRSGTASRVSQFVVLDALYTILTAQNDPVLYSELHEQHKRALEKKEQD